MRPYITVVLDSFHEAFASRVLYLLLLVLTIVLAALAPLGYNEQRMLELRSRDIHDWPAFIKELRRQAGSDTETPGKRITELAGDTVAQIVKEPAGTGELTSAQVNDIVGGLNSLLTKNSLYDEAAWSRVRLRDATQKLLAQGPGTLSQDDLVYFNRLLLRDAFPANFSAVGDKELYLTYAWWTMPEPIPGGKTWFPQIVKATLGAFMDIFVGMVAIFVAVLVTSPIVPRTFEPGAIDLLLSKPISRSLLIIAKYFGGCAFILLSAGYFIVGLWLIIGLRLNVWSEKLPLCIPIFMFQFAIYYAVSMLAGVIWRNAIVSIVVTVLFFLSCFTVGTAKLAIEQYITPNQLDRIVPVKESIVGVTRLGHFVQWDDKLQSWDEVLQDSDRRSGRPFAPMMPARIIGPVYHLPSQSLFYLKQSSQGPPMRFLSPGSAFMTAKWSGNWKADAGPTPPAGASWIFQDAQANVLLVSATGVFMYTPTEGQQKSRPKILGFELPLKTGDDPFVRVGPQEGFPFSVPYSAAIDLQSNRLLIDNEQLLLLLTRTDEKVEYTVQTSVNHEPNGPTLLGLTSRLAVVASKTGQVQMLNGSNLQAEQTFRPAGYSPPLCIETSNDGRFIAVLFHNGCLWLYDDQSHQGKVLDRNTTAITFNGTQLFSADSRRNVRVQDLGTDTTVKVYAASLDTLRWYYYWLIEPLYTVFPKPGELSNVVKSMLNEDTIITPHDRESEDLRVTRITPNTTGPVIHGTIFVLIMLSITCAYVERLDL